MTRANAHFDVDQTRISHIISDVFEEKDCLHIAQKMKQRGRLLYFCCNSFPIV